MRSGGRIQDITLRRRSDDKYNEMEIAFRIGASMHCNIEMRLVKWGILGVQMDIVEQMDGRETIGSIRGVMLTMLRSLQWNCTIWRALSNPKKLSC